MVTPTEKKWHKPHQPSSTIINPYNKWSGPLCYHSASETFRKRSSFPLKELDGCAGAAVKSTAAHRLGTLTIAPLGSVLPVFRHNAMDQGDEDTNHRQNAQEDGENQTLHLEQLLLTHVFWDGEAWKSCGADHKRLEVLCKPSLLIFCAECYII